MGRPSKLTLSEFVRSDNSVKAEIYERVMSAACKEQAQRLDEAWAFFAQACEPIEPTWIIVSVGERSADAIRQRMSPPVTFTYGWGDGSAK